MGKIRDTNKSRILLAQNDLRKSQKVDPLNVRNLEHFAKRTINRAWYANQWPISGDVNILEGYSDDECIPYEFSTEWRLYVPHSPTRLNVLHGLAHTAMGHNPHTKTPHETDFVKMYIELVRRFYSGRIDDTLKKVFKQELISRGVKTKKVSEETRQKQREAYLDRVVPTEDELWDLLEEIVSDG